METRSIADLFDHNRKIGMVTSAVPITVYESNDVHAMLELK